MGRSAITRWSLVVLAASTFVALTACGDDDDDDSADTAAAGTGAPEDAGELEGATWLLVEGGQLEAPLDGVTVTAQFVEGTLSGSSGCNTYTTMYELDGSSLSVAPEIASTMRACGDPEKMKTLDAAIPLARMAQPEEIGSVVAFLAGDGASYVTATTVFADGGIMHSSPGL